MRLLALVLFAIVAAPVSAQPADGGLNPQTLIDDLNSESDDLSAEIAAANAHPLGSLANPVRVGGPEGEHAYIGRLRCADGSQPVVGLREQLGAGGFGSLVDGYALDCGKAAPGKVTLIMDKYHAEHVEDRAPPGFAIAPRQ